MVHSWKKISGAKAPVFAIEAEEAIAAVRKDKRVIDALNRRGIKDIEAVHMETWPIGAQIPKYLDDGRRLIWTPMWHRPTTITGPANHYAHPISNLHAIVDLDTRSVVEIEDAWPSSFPIPQTPAPFRQNQTGANLLLQPLSIKQPSGVSFQVNGWGIIWERWNLRVGFCQREGLIIHDVRFDDNGQKRRIAHRLSISELVIPYGDASQDVYRKNAFDTGEFGLGNYLNSLVLGCDCLGEIHYLDVAVTGADGVIRTIRNAICMHEEDNGLLWKHVDIDAHVEVRRARRFVG